MVKAETGLVLVDPLGKPVRPELYSDSLRRLTLAARLGVIHLYLVRRTLAVAMDRAGVAPVDAAPPLATQGRILTMYESTQGVHSFRAGLAPLFDLEPDHVRVISPYGGGGFGSKLKVHAQAVLAAMAAHELPGRAVKVTLTRQQTFSLSGYRPPTIQYARLGADLVVW